MQEWRRVVREDLTDHRENAPATTADKRNGRGRKKQERGGGGGGGGKEAATAWVEAAGGYLSLPQVQVSNAAEFRGDFVNKSRPAVIKVRAPRGALVCRLVKHLREKSVGKPRIFSPCVMSRTMVTRRKGDFLRINLHLF